MRIGRAVIISVTLALSTAGSVLAVSAAPAVAAAHAPVAHAHSLSTAHIKQVRYHA